MTDNPPAGWHADPSQPGRLRWWDGQRWTDHTQAQHHAAQDLPPRQTAPPSGAAPRPAGSAMPRSIVIAVVAAGVLLFAIIGGVLAMVLVGDGAPLATRNDQQSVPGEPLPHGVPEGAGEPAGEAPFVEAAPQPPPEAPESAAELVDVEFDGMCTVQVGSDALHDGMRPWQFDECRSAPIALQADEVRWIVVLASLNGDDFSFDDALRRAADRGVHNRVLWSTHYPSLNPHLWVVYDGPFPTEAHASSTASQHGGGAYARELSDNPDDRYCIAADGCLGERNRN